MLVRNVKLIGSVKTGYRISTSFKGEKRKFGPVRKSSVMVIKKKATTEIILYNIIL